MIDDLNIGLVVSRFNWEIVEPLLNQTMEQLEVKGFNEEEISIYPVPGALEIPIITRKVSLFHDVIICLGAVVRGETTHYDIVSEQVSRALADISLVIDTPIINGILTVENQQQGLDRVNRGSYFADSAVDMGVLCHKLDEEKESLLAEFDDYPMFEEN